MKIYCDTTEYDISKLEPYIGKDIWIHCIKGSSGGSSYWVRFIKKIHNNWVQCNEVSDWSLDNPNGTLYKNRKRPFVDTGSFFNEDLQYLDFTDTKTTAELLKLSDYTFENNRFDKFVGKPVWVKVYKEGTVGFDEYYMNIEAKEGNVITYWLVEAYPLEYIESNEDSYGPPSESIMEYGRSFTDVWELINPLEILTEDEMDEIIEKCDAYWEEHHEEDYDDEEEEE